MPDHPAATPHGQLEPLADDVWWLQGTVSMGPGLRLNRVMVVLRHEGSLTLVNSIRLDPEGLAALTALGRIDHVVKIGTHGMDDPFYVETTGAQTWGLPGVTWKGLRVDHTLTQGEPTSVPWVQVHVFDHTVGPEAVLLADRGDGLLITCDSLQAWSNLSRCTPLAKGVIRASGFLKRPVVIGPPWLRGNTPAGGSLEPDYRRIQTLTFDALVGGHGEPLRSGAKAHVVGAIEGVYGPA